MYYISDQQLLKHKRLEQAAAVKNLIQLKDVDQQKKLVNELIASMIKLLRNAEELVKAAKFNSRLAKMPNDEKLQEHVSEVIENTPFFMELALYYPKLVNKFYLKEEIKDLINWAYRFSLDFNLYDELTMKMLDLAAQELLIIPRREDFINPYNKLAMREVLQAEVVAAAKEAKEKELTKKKEYMKKQKRNNGPSLSRGEL